jgi:mono/diheme cytochrome c family protein
MRIAIWVSAAAVAVVVLLSAASAAEAQEPDGEELYQANCSQCHQAGGVGVPGLFPPLAGNDNVQDAGYVRGVITNGLDGQIEVLGESYDGVMPSIGGLSDAEVDAIVEYLQVDLQASQASTATTVAPDLGTPIIGEELVEAAARGRRLFAGWESLENGGPACLACHTAGDLGNLSGPGLGPDLGDALDTFGGGAGVRAALAGPHGGRMAALYTNDPLTIEERVELAAFLEVESGTSDQWLVDGLVVIALGGLVLLIGYAFAIGFARRDEGSAS